MCMHACGCLCVKVRQNVEETVCMFVRACVRVCVGMLKLG